MSKCKKYFDFLSPQLYFTYLIYYRMENRLNYYTHKKMLKRSWRDNQYQSETKRRNEKAQPELTINCEEEKINEKS